MEKKDQQQEDFAQAQQAPQVVEAGGVGGKGGTAPEEVGQSGQVDDDKEAQDQPGHGHHRLSADGGVDGSAQPAHIAFRRIVVITHQVSYITCLARRRGKIFRLCATLYAALRLSRRGLTILKEIADEKGDRGGIVVRSGSAGAGAAGLEALLAGRGFAAGQPGLSDGSGRQGGGTGHRRYRPSGLVDGALDPGALLAEINRAAATSSGLAFRVASC